MSGLRNVVGQLQGRHAPPPKGARCAAAVGNVYSGPRACDRTARWIVTTDKGEAFACGIHVRRVDRDQAFVFVARVDGGEP
jgi:hypothetical protein